MRNNEGVNLSQALGILLGKLTWAFITLCFLSLIGMFLWNVGIGEVVGGVEHIGFFTALAFMIPIYVLHFIIWKFWNMYLMHKESMYALQMMYEQANKEDGTD